MSLPDNIWWMKAGKADVQKTSCHNAVAVLMTVTGPE